MIENHEFFVLWFGTAR